MRSNVGGRAGEQAAAIVMKRGKNAFFIKKKWRKQRVSPMGLGL